MAAGSSGAGRRGVLIVDRDGVVNVELGRHVRTLADWQPLAGSLIALARLSRAGYRVAVATNQSGVERGRIGEAALGAIHERLRRSVAALGGAIAAIAYCPHRPEADCRCRKPRPGLIHRIETELGVDARNVPFVGDSMRDLEAARAAGCRPVLVRTGNGARVECAARAAGYSTVFDSLAAFAHAVLERDAT